MVNLHDSIHIIYGETAGGCFKLAYSNQKNRKYDHLLILRDPLSYGPLLKCAYLEKWNQTRQHYLETLFGYLGIDFTQNKTDLLNNTFWINDFDFIYIWAGIGLEDQLLILFVVYLVELLGAKPQKIKLIQYETFPGESMPMYAMGYLDPIQMRTHPEPRSLTEQQLDYYRTAWNAVSASNPQHLIKFLSAQQSDKHLASALHLLLRRYPRYESGLDYWDDRIIAHTGKRYRSMARIMRAVWGNGYSGDYLPDFILRHKISHLANNKLPEPLLKLSGEQTSFKDTKVALTKFGLAVQKGEASFCPTNPIDIWVGGVHLSSATGHLWFYKDGQLVESNSA